MAGLETASATSAANANDFKDLTVNCPSGKRVLGGGIRLTGADGSVAVDSSRPFDADTWVGAGREVNPTAVNWSITVYAVCATVA